MNKELRELYEKEHPPKKCVCSSFVIQYEGHCCCKARERVSYQTWLEKMVVMLYKKVDGYMVAINKALGEDYD